MVQGYKSKSAIECLHSLIKFCLNFWLQEATNNMVCGFTPLSRMFNLIFNETVIINFLCERNFSRIYKWILHLRKNIRTNLN